MEQMPNSDTRSESPVLAAQNRVNLADERMAVLHGMYTRGEISEEALEIEEQAELLAKQAALKRREASIDTATGRNRSLVHKVRRWAGRIAAR